MEWFFGLPLAGLAVVLSGLTAALSALILVLALRRPVLVKIGVRQIPRRRARSVLIVIGLALSTTIVAASLLTGDILGETVRAVVAGPLGSVDEVVVSYQSTSRPFANASFRSFAEGQAPSVAGDDFAAAEAGRVAAALRDEPGVAGVVGVLIRPVAVADPAGQTASGGFSVIAAPADLPAAFGPPATFGGDPAPLGDLGDGEVYVNAVGAGALDLQASDDLIIYHGRREIGVRVRAITANGSLGGNQATILAPLAWWQAAEGNPGRINHVLIANQGGPDSLRWSASVTRRLRSTLIDPATADRLFRLLATPGVRRALQDSLDRQSPLVRPRLERLSAAIDRPAADEEFTSLIGDPQVIAGLRPILFALGPEAREAGLSALNQIGRLTVIELRQLSVDLAGRFASAVTSIFLVLGLLSIATGILLVCLIFALLAAERRSELGLARALGTQRGDLVQIFLFEGAVYDLGASLIGVLAGLGVAVLMTSLLGGYLDEYGVRIARSVEPQSLAIAFCLGLLITFATVTLAAWRIARLNIVAAVRDLPAEPGRVRRSRAGRWTRAASLAWGGLLPVGVGGGLVLIAGRSPVRTWLVAIGWSILLIGVAFVIRRLLARRGTPRARRDRIGVSLAGFGILLAWSQPVAAQGSDRVDRLAGDLGLIGLAGVITVFGAAAVAACNLEVLPTLVTAAIGRLRRGGPLVAGLRLAAQYPARHRWRTGLSVLMFALVTCTVTAATVLVAGTRHAYADLGVQAAGFDLRAGVDPARLPDLRSALATAPAVGPDAFAAIGGQASLMAEAIEIGAPAGRWQSASVQVVDAGWLAGVAAPLTHRAPGYADDRAVWAAVRDVPGRAVIHGSALVGRDDPDAAPDPLGAAPFALQGAAREDPALTPIVLWLRDPRGGPPLRIEVIGVLDRRASLGEGIYLTPATLQSAGWAAPPARTYYLKLAPGQAARPVVLGLGRSFGGQGLTVTVLGEELRTVQGIRLLLNELLQGFLGLGLVSGVVAIGVIASRAVVERRQQIGVLRAVGCSRRLIQATFLLEASLVAALGLVIGTGLGVLLAHNVIDRIARDRPEIQFGAPWGQLGLICLVAYAATLVTAAIPAWQAGRVPPAEALRYE
ncbi:MAG TPA: FtsX-like permease family protein [Dehalococcoidia bacterium]|nr:FtsX-like permease family protein [Dehalococcoidia bacterium]